MHAYFVNMSITCSINIIVYVCSPYLGHQEHQLAQLPKPYLGPLVLAFPHSNLTSSINRLHLQVITYLAITILLCYQFACCANFCFNSGPFMMQQVPNSMPQQPPNSMHAMWVNIIFSKSSKVTMQMCRLIIDLFYLSHPWIMLKSNLL